MIKHMVTAKTGPVCAALNLGDGETGRWSLVTCQGCLAKRPPQSKRNRKRAVPNRVPEHLAACKETNS